MYEVMLVLAVVIYVAVCVSYLQSGLASLYHPMTMYAAFHGFVFVVRPIIVHVMNYRLIYGFYMFEPSQSDKVTALAISSLGLVVFAIFCLRAGNVPMTFRNGLNHQLERSILRKTLLPMMLVCVPLGLYSLLTTLDASAADISDMVSRNGVKVNTTSVGYINDAKLLLVPVCALFAWFLRFRLYSFIPLAVFFLLKAASGGRGPFVIAVASAALFYFYDKKVRFPTLRIFVAAALMMIVFNVIGQDRGYALRKMLGYENVAAATGGDTGEHNLLEGMDFANMEYLEYIVYVVPQRSGTYDYFLQNLQLLTEPVPRAFWPGKPVGAPIKTIDLFAYGNPMGLTASVPGVGWYELGWVGVVVWCGLWGWALGRFYRWFVAGPQDAISVALYMVMIPMFIVAYRDGALLTIARSAVFYLAPVLIIMGVRRINHYPSFSQIVNRPRQNVPEHSQLGIGKATRLRLIASQKPSHGSRQA